MFFILLYLVRNEFDEVKPLKVPVPILCVKNVMHEWCIDILCTMKILQYPVIWKTYSRQEKQKEFINKLKVYILKWESF